MNQFADKVVLITGGGGAIGSATARRLAAEGASVAVLDMDGARSAAIAAELGPKAMALTADVAEEVQVGQAINALIARYGRLECPVQQCRHFPAPPPPSSSCRRRNGTGSWGSICAGPFWCSARRSKS